MVIEDYTEMVFLQTVLKKLGFDVESTQNPRSFSGQLLSLNPDILVMTAYGKRVHGLELSRNLRRARGLPRTILLRLPGQPDEDPSSLADRWLESPVQALSLLETIADLCGLNKALLSEKFQKLHMQEVEDPNKARILKMDPTANPTLEKSDKPENGPASSATGASSATSATPAPAPGLASAPAPGSPSATASGVPAGDAPAGISGASPATIGPASAPAQHGNLQPTSMPVNERRDRYKRFLDEKPPKEHSFAVREVVDHVKALRKAENKADLADLERERREFVQHLFRKKA